MDDGCYGNGDYTAMEKENNMSNKKNGISDESRGEKIIILVMVAMEMLTLAMENNDICNDSRDERTILSKMVILIIQMTKVMQIYVVM